MSSDTLLFHQFKKDVSGIELPVKFNYPFNYTPHDISIIAAEELIDFLEHQFLPSHQFGADGKDGFGKMFGVLVVLNDLGQLGYLGAFSGKLMESNHHSGFVPPVFDILKKEGFFKVGERKIREVTADLERLESELNYHQLCNDYDLALVQCAKEIEEFNKEVNLAKKKRRIIRDQTKDNSDQVLKQLDEESADFHYQMKNLKASCREKLENLSKRVREVEERINTLKEKRKKMSAELQLQLFENYAFLNSNGESKSLNQIFHIDTEIVPPSGAGECCAPKLMQYAYLHNMKPISMAEFWYGKSPSSEIRKHKHYYPACRSKCLPILKHMMEGLDVEENSMLIRLKGEKNIEVLYEDSSIVVLNKPTEFLSVPGAKIEDSVYLRIKEMYPLASGPLIVHRLDMSTSGIMLIALTKRAHYHLQRQFENKTIRKRYVAILDGLTKEDFGVIDLPIRVDIDDRPRQLVDFEHGKPSYTEWNVIKKNASQTLVNFFPKTGRTHQLRVHASHPLGLNIPILGDDLYGTRSERLFLHAEEIEFIHPITELSMRFEKKASFDLFES